MKGISKTVLNNYRASKTETPFIPLETLVENSRCHAIIVDMANVFLRKNDDLKLGRDDEENDRNVILKKWETMYNSVLQHFENVCLVFNRQEEGHTEVLNDKTIRFNLTDANYVKLIHYLFPEPYSDGVNTYDLFANVDPKDEDFDSVMSHVLRINKDATDENWEKYIVYIDSAEPKDSGTYIADHNFSKDVQHEICIKGLNDNLRAHWLRTYPRTRKENEEIFKSYGDDHITHKDILNFVLRWIHDYNVEHGIKNVYVYITGNMTDDDNFISMLSEQLYSMYNNPQQFNTKGVEKPETLMLPFVLSNDIDAYFYNPHAYIIEYADYVASFKAYYARQVLYDWGFPTSMLNVKSLKAFMAISGSDFTKKHIGKAIFDIQTYEEKLFHDLRRGKTNQIANKKIAELRSGRKLYNYLFEIYCKDNLIPVSYDPIKIATNLMNKATTSIALKCGIQCHLQQPVVTCEAASEDYFAHLHNTYADLLDERAPPTPESASTSTTVDK